MAVNNMGRPGAMVSQATIHLKRQANFVPFRESEGHKAGG